MKLYSLNTKQLLSASRFFVFYVIFFTDTYTYAQPGWLIHYDVTTTTTQGKRLLEAYWMWLPGKGVVYREVEPSAGQSASKTVYYYHFTQGKQLLEEYYHAESGAMHFYRVNIPLDCLQVKWQFSNDEKRIEGYTCQKALGTLMGLRIEAWYSSKLPTSIGPWRLYGLPGAVLELTAQEVGLSIRAKRIEKKALSLPASPFYGQAMTVLDYNSYLEHMARQSGNDFVHQVKANLGGMLEHMTTSQLSSIQQQIRIQPFYLRDVYLERLTKQYIIKEIESWKK